MLSDADRDYHSLPLGHGKRWVNGKKIPGRESGDWD
jgi:hypothetical protein